MLTGMMVGGACSLLVVRCYASIIFQDDFAYPNGNLEGQPGWVQDATGTPHVTVDNQQVKVVGTGGDSVTHTFSSAVPNTAGTSFYMGINLNVSAATTTGDYFFYAKNGGSVIDRLHVQASNGGYVLGIQASSSGTTLTYSSTTLAFNTSHRVILAFKFLSGSGNDQASIYVDPTQSNQALETPLVTSTSSGDPSSISAVNFRTLSNGPDALVDNLIVSDSFAEAIPEPTNVALGLFGSVMTLAASARAIVRRRRNSRGADSQTSDRR